MREIKFRQMVNGKFHYWGFIDGLFISPMVITGDEPANLDSAPYIGLKDEQGKEIFGGDIVSYPAYNGEEYELFGIVEYDGCGFCLRCISSNKEDFLGKYYSFGSWDNNFQLRKGKITGNIYDPTESLIKKFKKAKNLQNIDPKSTT